MTHTNGEKIKENAHEIVQMSDSRRNYKGAIVIMFRENMQTN